MRLSGTDKCDLVFIVVVVMLIAGIGGWEMRPKQMGKLDEKPGGIIEPFGPPDQEIFPADQQIVIEPPQTTPDLNIEQ